ncbi:MAG: antitoxin HipB [Methanobacterium sp. PtaB.Bin024]|jgi:putative transcriptional regulator|nr:MAG: antitoxin HipB [Methanobacterium sp. PtaB.Bin024]
MKNNLKVYRAMQDLTQEELAKKLGVTRQTIIAIEKEKYDPSLILAFKIAKFFKIQIEDVFIYPEINTSNQME